MSASCVGKVKKNKNGSAIAECLLEYGNKNIDEYVSLELAGLSVNEIIAKHSSSIIQHATKMSREIIRRATIAKTEREIYGKTALNM